MQYHAHGRRAGFLDLEELDSEEVEVGSGHGSSVKDLAFYYRARLAS